LLGKQGESCRRCRAADTEKSFSSDPFAFLVSASGQYKLNDCGPDLALSRPLEGGF
jgi:hypothetical protein